MLSIFRVVNTSKWAGALLGRPGASPLHVSRLQTVGSSGARRPLWLRIFPLLLFFIPRFPCLHYKIHVDWKKKKGGGEWEEKALSRARCPASSSLDRAGFQLTDLAQATQGEGRRGRHHPDPKGKYHNLSPSLSSVARACILSLNPALGPLRKEAFLSACDIIFHV